MRHVTLSKQKNTSFQMHDYNPDKDIKSKPQIGGRYVRVSNDPPTDQYILWSEDVAEAKAKYEADRNAIYTKPKKVDKGGRKSAKRKAEDELNEIIEAIPEAY